MRPGFPFGPGRPGPHPHAGPCARPAFGSFGPPFGGPGFGGFGPGPRGPRGRHGGRARRGDVRASLLALLRERPMHGYEMIREIAERTSGAWRPSPGSVYPNLQMLEEEGLIRSREEGGKRLFELTDSGRAEADAGPEAPWEEAAGGPGPDWEAAQDAMKSLGGLADALRQVVAAGSAEQRTKALALLAETRRRLYLILAEED
ncbi:PadR family transcriptional regulator [Streptacidiphilus sp. ASG 303]|uniref:PadR family transcriptional regulator n=1 Tax=Streptacidiphilus sp. ASG 303 TaxID=2896847 RepID=UPI001E2A2DC6|nr:PadR family transcriptional regulator [Streptacidiphilus sp. ASG 303]MCD0484437.1 PadR family transcriptional regulator [Streptacidiphilus sp. ASG 303]